MPGPRRGFTFRPDPCAPPYAAATSITRHVHWNWIKVMFEATSRMQESPSRIAPIPFYDLEPQLFQCVCREALLQVEGVKDAVIYGVNGHGNAASISW
jgi:hypothetical protein